MGGPCLKHEANLVPRVLRGHWERDWQEAALWEGEEYLHLHPRVFRRRNQNVNVKTYRSLILEDEWDGRYGEFIIWKV